MRNSVAVIKKCNKNKYKKYSIYVQYCFNIVKSKSLFTDINHT